jgi:hypothetical protein
MENAVLTEAAGAVLCRDVKSWVRLQAANAKLTVAAGAAVSWIVKS